MMLDNIELMKIFDFILENKDIVFSSGLFDLNTLAMIRAVVKGKMKDVFKLTDKQCGVIINTFISLNCAFNEDTPSIITNDKKCIELAISRDINSIDYIRFIDLEIKKYVIDKAILDNYILKANSPNDLKDDFLLVLNSVRLEKNSSDYINWSSFSLEEVDLLIDEILKNGYVLSDSSCKFLRNNLKIVLASLKKDINNIKFASIDMVHDKNVFGYLIMNGYQYSSGYIKDRTLDYFLNRDVMDVVFRKIKIYNSDNEKYIDNFNRLFNDFVNSKPLIKTFDSVFGCVAEQMWKEYRRENNVYYDNIFGKICSELRNCDEFETAIANMKFVTRMFEVLDDRYELLYKAMYEYYNIYHSKIDNKIDKLKVSKDMISKLSALYVAKSKENYKRKKIKDFYEYIGEYFSLNLDNPYIYKKIILSHNKEKFKNDYCNGDDATLCYVNELCRRYYKYYDRGFVDKVVFDFIVYNRTLLSDIILEPENYNNYLRYEKAIKLIRRLNSGYIKFDGVEMLGYHDIISFDDKIKQYVYVGDCFTERDIKIFNEYKNKVLVFNKIKKEIMMKINMIDFNGKIDRDIVNKLSRELPFTDEYFKFDTESVLRKFTLCDLIDACFGINDKYKEELVVCDSIFNNIYNLMVNNGIMWLLLFLDYKYYADLAFYGVKKEKIVKIINNMDNICNFANEFKFDLTEFGELLFVSDIIGCTDKQSLAILGKDIIEKLYKYKEYTDYDEDEIVSAAKEFVCQMVKRSKSTVPYVSGKYYNYNYSMYDSQDESILVCGIDTDSCFRIGGTDNDFLHYCAVDKNGFVIKITDEFGNFIARAAGFRNGNCVFINQLRTIYDEGGNYYLGGYIHERKDIIETFKMACQDILNVSLKNKNEKQKIEFVFVTQSYALDTYDSNVNDRVWDEIGCVPMDVESDDWDNFIDNTDNLMDAFDEECFATDYGEYSLICMASVIDISKIKPRHIKRKDVPALYERVRNKIIVTNKINSDIIRKINKIRAIKAFYDENDEFEIFDIIDNLIVFVGDNWYIICDNNNIIDCCLLEFDDKAKIEFEATKQVLLHDVFDNNLQADCIKILTKINEKTSKKIV